MILQAEATTLHTRFRYALALFLVVIPEQALNDSQAEGIIHTLERMNDVLVLMKRIIRLNQLLL